MDRSALCALRVRPNPDCFQNEEAVLAYQTGVRHPAFEIGLTLGYHRRGVEYVGAMLRNTTPMGDITPLSGRLAGGPVARNSTPDQLSSKGPLESLLIQRTSLRFSPFRGSSRTGHNSCSGMAREPRNQLKQGAWGLERHREM